MAPPKIAPEKRVHKYIRFDGPLAKNNPELGRCWIWTGKRTPEGYPCFWAGGKTVGAHRWLYVAVGNRLPYNLPLDHFACDNGAGGCVNPRHLRPVTTRENVLRSDTNIVAINAAKTHCIHGHPFDVTNTYVAPQGGRGCRTCLRRRSAEYRMRRDENASV